MTDPDRDVRYLFPGVWRRNWRGRSRRHCVGWYCDMARFGLAFSWVRRCCGTVECHSILTGTSTSFGQQICGVSTCFEIFLEFLRNLTMINLRHSFVPGTCSTAAPPTLDDCGNGDDTQIQTTQICDYIQGTLLNATTTLHLNIDKSVTDKLICMWQIKFFVDRLCNVIKV